MYRTLNFIWNHPLTKRHRWAAFSRWLRWQLGSRLVRSPVLVPFVGKSLLVIERSMVGATGNHYCGLHEFADMAFILHGLREGDLFLDIGANVGSYTVLASGVVGCETISAEPAPSTFEKLTRNVRVNGLESKVDLKNCPIGESTSTVWFSLDRDAMNRVVEEEYPGDKIGLPVRTIDEILSEHPHSNRPMIWKVDVEGFESKVLQGAEASLRKAQVMAVLLEANQPEITKKMEGFGFQLADYDPWLRQVIPVTDGQAQRSTSNYLWIRDYRWISERCQSAGMVEVLGERF